MHCCDAGGFANKKRHCEKQWRNWLLGIKQPAQPC